MTTASLPFFSVYDPVGTSEGTLDPLGLYQIADQLAIRLVPAVRERMQRIRFLTAIAVGTRVLEGLDDAKDRADIAPFLAWEWLLVEAFVRASDTGPIARGVAGVQVVQRAVDKFGYVDAATYLKTPRVFGFHGIYKRLAVHLGITDVHLAAGPQGIALFDDWAADYPDGGRAGALDLVKRCRRAVERGLGRTPPRTAAPFRQSEWEELALALSPDRMRTREKRLLRNLLLQSGTEAVGALADIWDCLHGLKGLSDRDVLKALGKRAPGYTPLLAAIDAYEMFARAMQDAFDYLRHGADAAGMIVLPRIAAQKRFAGFAKAVPAAFSKAARAFSKDGLPQGQAFAERFTTFGAEQSAEQLARELLAHHVRIQHEKSADGKRAWFDVVDDDRRYWRERYHLDGWVAQPAAFVHDYRCAPISRFRDDLT